MQECFANSRTTNADLTPIPKNMLCCVIVFQRKGLCSGGSKPEIHVQKFGRCFRGVIFAVVSKLPATSLLQSVVAPKNSTKPQQNLQPCKACFQSSRATGLPAPCGSPSERKMDKGLKGCFIDVVQVFKGWPLDVGCKAWINHCFDRNLMTDIQR